jgi:hypothetical protein
MLTAGAILPNSISNTRVYMTVTTNGGSGITNPTAVTSQTSGTTGGAGVYVVDTSQTVGSSGSPVTIFIQNIYGTDSNWWSPATGISPGYVSLGQHICNLEANLMPWCYWALDDHDIGTNQETSWIGWFGMQLTGQTWSVPSGLTVAGMDMVFNPCYGLRTLAAPPSSYV